MKFNAALADHSSNENPHTIDGIVLTKFDTIDDKVRDYYPFYLGVFSLIPGWLGYFHDLHQWSAYCVRWDRTDLPGPQEPRCQGRGLSPHEIERLPKFESSFFSLTRKYLTCSDPFGKMHLFNKSYYF